MVRRLLSVIVVIGFVGILFAQEVAYRHITAIGNQSADTLQKQTSQQPPQRRRIVRTHRTDRDCKLARRRFRP